MAAELESLEVRKQTLQALLAAEPPAPVRLHPNLAETYRQRVEDLRQALDQDDVRAAAAEIFRGLIDEIRLVPVDDGLGIYLIGNLAAMLGLGTKKRPGSKEAGAQLTLVTGARNCLDLLLTSTMALAAHVRTSTVSAWRT